MNSKDKQQAGDGLTDEQLEDIYGWASYTLDRFKREVRVLLAAPRQPGEMGAEVQSAPEKCHGCHSRCTNNPPDCYAIGGAWERKPAASAQRDERDAKFFRWLTDDLAGDERQVRNALLERMAVMSYSAACDAIDAAIAESRCQSEQCKQPCERFCACDRKSASAQQDEREAFYHFVADANWSSSHEAAAKAWAAALEFARSQK